MDTSSPDRLAAHLMAFVSSSRVSRRRISRGGSVFRQGDTGTAIFIVETGRVRLVRTLSDGTTLTLYVAEAGESFAEAVLSAASYHCDAVADIDSVVISLPKSDLLSALSSDPAKCLELAMALAGQVRDLRARLELRNIRSATERLLTWLHLHASGDPPSVPIRRSWTSIAGEIGLTREAVYRALAMLDHQGQISREPDAVRLIADRIHSDIDI